jgi:hypothetical protein
MFYPQITQIIFITCVYSVDEKWLLEE